MLLMRKSYTTFFYCSFGALLLFVSVFQVQTVKGQSQTEQLQEQLIPGQAYVKFKPEFAFLLKQHKGERRQQFEQLFPGLEVNEVTPLNSGQKDAKNQARRLKSTIDLGLYFQLGYNPELSAEQALRLIYQSGKVEIAEPVPLRKTSYKPNDPRIDQQYYLNITRAFEAWDVERTNGEVVIAVIDAGVDLDHPDLMENIYTNEADPIDGIDNDNDGYVDNYYGWDFVGADYEDPAGDNDPDVSTQNLAHGTYVAGCAAAVADNKTGIAGMSFNAKIMAVKVSADNDTRSNGSGYILGGIQGILYAASHGAHVINASYGGPTYSQIEQDIIRAVSLDYGALVVAASGNEASPEPHYPSDYDFVLSVAASNSFDQRADFSNYGYNVDLSAPGANILTTDINGGYTTINGTSFSSPIVAGAAALVKAKYPDFAGVQVGELLRITADQTFLNSLTSEYKDKMGRGRLDTYAALTSQSPSVRLDQSRIEGPSGDIAKPGDLVGLYGAFYNFLWEATNLEITLSSESEYVSVENGTLEVGQLGMLDGIVSEEDPFFTFQVSENVPFDTEITLRFDYTADGYQDVQYIRLILNPSYFNLNENLVATSIINDGRIGFQDIENGQGQGFVFNNINMLYEMGIIAGTSASQVISNVRNNDQGFDTDFRSKLDIERLEPGSEADVEIIGSFTDEDATSADEIGLNVQFTAYAWKEAPYENFVIVQYKIENTSDQYINDLYFGLFADWDINLEDFNDKADWDEETATGYVYTPAEENRLVAGIQVLTGLPQYWAIDNDGSISGNPFGIYDGFSDAEKWKAISSGIGRSQAGSAEGNDVSQVIAAGPLDITEGSSTTVAFALHGAFSIDELKNSAEAARDLYINTFGLPPTKAEDRQIEGLRLYPNPTRSKLYLTLPASAEPYQLRIVDVLGKLQAARQLEGGSLANEINMPQKNGMYYVEIIQSQKRSVYKVIVAN